MNSCLEKKRCAWWFERKAGGGGTDACGAARCTHTGCTLALQPDAPHWLTDLQLEGLQRARSGGHLGAGDRSFRARARATRSPQPFREGAERSRAAVPILRSRSRRARSRCRAGQRTIEGEFDRAAPSATAGCSRGPHARALHLGQAHLDLLVHPAARGKTPAPHPSVSGSDHTAPPPRHPQHCHTRAHMSEKADSMSSAGPALSGKLATICLARSDHCRSVWSTSAPCGPASAARSFSTLATTLAPCAARNHHATRMVVTTDQCCLRPQTRARRQRPTRPPASLLRRTPS